MFIKLTVTKGYLVVVKLYPLLFETLRARYVLEMVAFGTFFHNTPSEILGSTLPAIKCSDVSAVRRNKDDK